MCYHQSRGKKPEESLAIADLPVSLASPLATGAELQSLAASVDKHTVVDSAALAALKLTPLVEMAQTKFDYWPQELLATMNSLVVFLPAGGNSEEGKLDSNLLYEESPETATNQKGSGNHRV